MLFSLVARSIMILGSLDHMLLWINECCLMRFQRCSSLGQAVCSFYITQFCFRLKLLLVWWQGLFLIHLHCLRFDIYLLKNFVCQIFDSCQSLGVRQFRYHHFRTDSQACLVHLYCQQRSLFCCCFSTANSIHPQTHKGFHRPYPLFCTWFQILCPTSLHYR